MFLRIAAITLLLLSAPAIAVPRQNPGPILDAIKRFLSSEVANQNGTLELQINAADLRLSLPECTQLQVFIPPGSKPSGKTSVAVRCVGNESWIISLPVQIAITGYYLAVAHELEPGHVLCRGDLVVKEGDLAQLPPDILSFPEQALGKTVTARLAGGEPLQSHMMQEWDIAKQTLLFKTALREQ